MRVRGHPQSTVVGEYTDIFQNVQLDESVFAVSGRVDTLITGGQGFFRNVVGITSTLYSPSLARIFVSYASGDYDLFPLGVSASRHRASSACSPCGAKTPAPPGDGLIAGGTGVAS